MRRTYLTVEGTEPDLLDMEQIAWIGAECAGWDVVAVDTSGEKHVVQSGIKNLEQAERIVDALRWMMGGADERKRA